jgi:lipopolysaccharide export system permease protein
MKIYQKFIAKLYLKNFLLIFIALELFFIGMDLLQNLKSISNSANLQILYTVNQLLYYVNFTLPLSLVFAMLLSLFNILKSNELVSLYALGVSKNSLIKPIFTIASIITLLYIGLNFTPDFVNAYEKAKNIKKYNRPDKTTSQLFLKSKETYAYIDELIPEKKEGKNLKIFLTKEHRLVEILEAKSAVFADNYWKLLNVTSIKIPELNTTAEDKKLIFTNLDSKEVLHGFKPKIIDTLFQKLSKLTIQDAFGAISFLKTEDLNSDKIRSNLYTMLVFPLFAPIAIYGLFFPFPAQRRGTNIALLSTIYIFSILSIWGILFTLAKISANGSVSPEYAILVPIVVLAATALYLSRKFQVKHI